MKKGKVNKIALNKGSNETVTKCNALKMSAEDNKIKRWLKKAEVLLEILESKLKQKLAKK